MPASNDFDAEVEFARVRDVAERRRQQQADLARSNTELADLLRALHARGYNWTELADRAGWPSQEAIRVWVGNHASPGAAPAVPEERLDLSVQQAAQRLGVHRTTVYARVDQGLLQAQRDRRGRLRIILDD